MITIKDLKNMIQELDQEEESYKELYEITLKNFQLKRDMYNKRIEEIRIDKIENS